MPLTEPAENVKAQLKAERISKFQFSPASSWLRFEARTSSKFQPPRTKWYDQVFAFIATLFKAVGFALVFVFGSRERVDLLTKELSHNRGGC
jgi:hypothetical protein